MMDIGSALQGTASLQDSFINLGSSIYNAWSQNRTYNYQKDLQKQLFRREDNAIQRRVADAEKAGFNKWSVLGEGSSAGSAVPVTTPQFEPKGSLFDTLSNFYGLVRQKAEAETAKNEEKNSKIAFDSAKLKYNEQLRSYGLDYAEELMDLGFQPQINIGSDGSYVVSYLNTQGSIPYSSTRYGQARKLDYQNVLTETGKSELENQFKWLPYVKDIVNMIFGGADTASRMRGLRRR